MNTFYVRTHMGLGDIILCNGLIRNICKKFDKVATFTKPEYETSVKFMYRDLKNLEIISKEEDLVDSFLNEIPLEEKIIVGFGNLGVYTTQNISFDEGFYRVVGLKFDRRWSDFYVERDLKTEKEFFKNLGLKKNEYIFVHDDASRGCKIKENYLPSDVKIFRPDKSRDNIFDYCTVISNAKEVHVMDSSFKHLIDSIDLNKNLFYHIYVRGNGRDNKTQSKLNWKNIEISK